MSRRRVVLVSSSSDEELSPQQEEDEEIVNPAEHFGADVEPVTLDSSNLAVNANFFTTPRNGNHHEGPILLDVSDEEEHGTNREATENAGVSRGFFAVSESSVSGLLEQMGLRLRREWVDSCLHELESSVRGFQGMDNAMKAKICFGKFLNSDMNYCGAGVLPPNVSGLHMIDLNGPFVLQVDEIVNISCSLRGRYQKAAAGFKRCLKLSMTDGVQRVFGIEYRPIKDLEVLAPAGLKVVICNVNIRHGLLMLVPEVLEVLGGVVEELEAARIRVVNEVNKPPRGRRNNTDNVPLATRASLAAWAPSNGMAPGHSSNTTTPGMAPPQANEQGTAVHGSVGGMHEQNYTTGHNNAGHNIPSIPRSQGHGELHRPNDFSQGSASVTPAGYSSRDDAGVLLNFNNDEPTTNFSFQPSSSISHPMEVTPGSATTAQAAMPIDAMGGGDFDTPNQPMDVEMTTEEISMDPEFKRNFLLTGDSEPPFVYLDSLSAKFETVENKSHSVRGLIKCFLTGVKGFQYKQRDSYELRVYVDDGSLISEILIDSKVVQDGIGYSPQEVTNALASPDPKRVNAMKETLKQFQIFLMNFEGTMLVEVNNSSLVPIALEMKQGFSASATWLLLRRLNSFLAKCTLH